MPGLPDRITREAYSHEVSSAGFWAGGAAAAEPFFYSYIYPEPDGYRAAKPAHGRFDETLRRVRPALCRGARPRATRRRCWSSFFQSTYDAAADLAHWDRAALEREPVAP